MSRTPPKAEQDGQSRLGPAPDVAGRERIRAKARAKLFGPDPASSPDDATELASGGSATTSHVDAATDAVPDRVGRFVVLSRLGRGGMGEVFEAYDPELDRKVALKLLRPELRDGSAGDAGPARLLREAQAMARLSDEHVITVHEVGTFRDNDEAVVFVAMELIEGQTLGQWMRERPPWQEVLAAFRRAGAGLSAAHRAGLVHRDFKPDNVLMADDGSGAPGRIRVVDFGLARALGTVTQTETSPSQPSGRRRTRPGPDPLQTPLTQTGAVMGTPAYMSPEQHLGRPADMRSDQFSFCVALWEGLYGVRPFPGSSYAELVRNVLDGEMAPVPAEVRVPRWVHAAVLRGLARDPAQRHENMDALLAALDRDPGRRWRRIAAGVLVAGVASGITFGFAKTDDAAVDACAEVQRRLDGVWDDARKAAVQAALTRAGPAGPRIWQTTERLLDAHTDAWTDTAADACAASLVGAHAADPIHARRQACLDMRLVEIQQLVDMLAEADAPLAHEAVQAAATLSDVRACSDPQRLRAWRAPADPAARQRLARARAQLSTAKAHGLLGHYDKAIELAQAVVDGARELDDPATEAAGLLVRGQYEDRAGKPTAERTLRDAVSRAEVAGDHATRVQALTHLIWVVGQDSERYVEAKALGVDAHAVLKVLGGAPLLEARLDNNLGVAAKVADEQDEARKAYEHALDLLVQLFGEEHPETARVLGNLGSLLSAEGRYEEAEAYLRRASQSFRAVLGDEHPFVAVVIGNLGRNLGLQKRYREAIPLFEQSLAIRLANFEPEHPLIPKSHYNLAFTLHAAGDYDKALTHLQRGLELLQRSDASEIHPLWFIYLGLTHTELGNYTEASSWFDRALKARKDEDDYALASLRFDAAKAMIHTDPARARDLVEQSAVALERHAEQTEDEDKARRDRADAAERRSWLEEALGYRQ